MARYIDADKLTVEVQRCLMPNVDIDGTVAVECAERYFLNLVKKQPTADVVEVEKYNDLRESFVDFACSGTNNLAPYCKNRCVECVDERGWCRHGDSCKGFNPDGRRDT